MFFEGHVACHITFWKSQNSEDHRNINYYPGLVGAGKMSRQRTKDI
jgi:hypothetical protein